ncbi:zinc finger protein 706 isoform X2 [Austrofundulus limnaeus]|uniref:Zinc finger protein 706 isoform X2 n=1 Tax=Austrofundulus limnaeus TaxID=52670 RepID=A0A2I4AIS0_AUSLI|nr:PREDICTED: zinc finger protein 706-like isoform X2 [Austrofundulus limnaeus]
MARGQQKIQSQQKNAKKAAEKKKGQGADQKTAAKAALVHTCPVCRVNTDLTCWTDTDARPQNLQAAL